MAQQINPFVISAPGFNGLNLQDSPIGLDPSFALIATNCIIDKSGRIAARQGWIRSHTSNSDLSTSNVTCIGEVVQNDGTLTTVAAGGAFLFKHSGATLTTLTYGGGGAAPTITAANWQFCQLNGIGIFWQRGHDPLIFDPAVSTTTFRRLSEKTGSINSANSANGAIHNCNAAISAYGRVWIADTTADKNTVVWSDLLTPHILFGGTSGSLNLIGVWPKGGDEIVALAAHNNFLIIFGKRQTLIYSGASTPSTMVLADSLNAVGCIARDSVQNTGDDILFLSDSGVRALMRTIQEKSAPMREFSANVRDNLQGRIGSETLANIKSVYSAQFAFYLLTMPVAKELYCFDLRGMLPSGAAKVTVWENIEPTAFLQSSIRKLYLGKAGYIGQYSGYYDHTTEYRMSYYTTWIDFGNPIQESILKKILLTVVGVNQSIVVKWAHDFDDNYATATVVMLNNTGSSEYAIDEFGLGEWSTRKSADILSVNGTGRGAVIQFGFETQIKNKPLSLQKITIYTKDSKLP